MLTWKIIPKQILKYVIAALAAYIVAEIIRKSVHFNNHESKLYNYTISMVSMIAIVFIFFLLIRYTKTSFPILRKNPLKKMKKIASYIKGDSQNQIAVEKSVKEQGFLYSLFDGGIRAPIIEEVIFRGLLFIVVSAVIYKVFKGKANNNIKDIMVIFTFIGVSSILFGWLHVSKHNDYMHIFTYALFGLFLAVVYVLTKNLLWTIMLHMINNITATLRISDKLDITKGTAAIASGIELVIYISYFYLMVRGIMLVWYCIKHEKHTLS